MTMSMKMNWIATWTVCSRPLATSCAQLNGGALRSVTVSRTRVEVRVAFSLDVVVGRLILSAWAI